LRGKYIRPDFPDLGKNSKSEARSTKQYQNPNFKCTKQCDWMFEFAEFWRRERRGHKSISAYVDIPVSFVCSANYARKASFVADLCLRPQFHFAQYNYF
jgi:hypothetical protein